MASQQLYDFVNNKSSKVFGIVKDGLGPIGNEFSQFILVCTSRHCSKDGTTMQLIEAFNKEIEKNDLKSTAIAVTSPCLGLCEQTPNIFISPACEDSPNSSEVGQIYSNVCLSDVPNIVTNHFVHGKTALNNLTIISEE